MAVLWSDVNDLSALEKIFAGKNAMSIEPVCGGVALSSTTVLLSRIKSACKGTHAVAALRRAHGGLGPQAEPVDQALLVDAGAVLSQLMVDGFRAETAANNPAAKGEAALPKEIDDARKLLDELPRFGLSGSANDATKVLAPRGSRHDATFEVRCGSFAMRAALAAVVT